MRINHDHHRFPVTHEFNDWGAAAAAAAQRQSINIQHRQGHEGGGDCGSGGYGKGTADCGQDNKASSWRYIGTQHCNMTVDKDK